MGGLDEADMLALEHDLLSHRGTSVLGKGKELAAMKMDVQRRGYTRKASRLHSLVVRPVDVIEN